MATAPTTPTAEAFEGLEAFDLGTPTRPLARSRKRVLEDVTNTPPSLSTVARSIRAITGGAPPAAAIVQRFSLKGRLTMGRRDGESASRLMPFRASLHPPCPVLQLPQRVSESVSMDMARLCACSSQPLITPGRRRLCQRDTCDHSEYQVLQAMGDKFSHECLSLAAAPLPPLAERASLQDLDVFFIIRPESEMIVGYIALSREGFAAHRRLLTTLTEVYVEPQYRRRGLAVAALRVLLAGCRAVAIPTSLFSEDRDACTRLLKKVGLMEGPGVGYYARTGLQDSENFR